MQLTRLRRTAGGILGGWSRRGAPSRHVSRGAESRVRLPRRRAPAVRGLRQRRPAAGTGADYEVDGGDARLQPLAREGGQARLLALAVDAARHRRHVPASNDTVDVIYTRAGSKVVATGLPFARRAGVASRRSRRRRPSRSATRARCACRSSKARRPRSRASTSRRWRRRLVGCRPGRGSRGSAASRAAPARPRPPRRTTAQARLPGPLPLPFSCRSGGGQTSIATGSTCSATQLRSRRYVEQVADLGGVDEPNPQWPQRSRHRMPAERAAHPNRGCGSRASQCPDRAILGAADRTAAMFVCRPRKRGTGSDRPAGPTLSSLGPSRATRISRARPDRLPVVSASGGVPCACGVCSRSSFSGGLALLAAGCGGSSSDDPRRTTSTTAASCDKASLELSTPGQLTIATDNPSFPPWFIGDEGRLAVGSDDAADEEGLRGRGRVRGRAQARLHRRRGRMDGAAVHAALQAGRQAVRLRHQPGLVQPQAGEGGRLQRLVLPRRAGGRVAQRARRSRRRSRSPISRTRSSAYQIGTTSARRA